MPRRRRLPITVVVQTTLQTKYVWNVSITLLKFVREDWLVYKTRDARKKEYLNNMLTGLCINHKWK